MSLPRQYSLPLITMFFFFTLDFIFTKQIIDVTGFEAEANPIMHWFLITYNTIWALLLIKIYSLWLLSMTALVVASRGKPATQNAMVYVLWSLVLITVFVDLWSVHVLKVVS